MAGRNVVRPPPEFLESQELPLDPELKRTAKGVIDQILQLRDSL
jgi:hypothetical protein